MRAFIAGERGTLIKKHTLAGYLGEGIDVEVVTKASVYGLGAYWAHWQAM